MQEIQQQSIPKTLQNQNPNDVQANKLQKITLQDIHQTMSKVFLQKENILTFYSQSISFVNPIAKAIYQILSENQHALIILCQFQDQQVDLINQKLHHIAIKKKLQKSDYIKNQPAIEKIIKYLKNKRRIKYAQGGVFAITQQVLLLDTLCHQFNPQRITKIIFNINNIYNQKIIEIYHPEIWIMTQLNIRNMKESTTVVLCKYPHRYTHQNLEKIYRNFFCKKIAIWPFGRAQINKYIKNKSTRFQQKQYILTLSQEEKQIQTILFKLIEVIQRQYNNKQQQSNKKLNGLLWIAGIKDSINKNTHFFKKNNAHKDLSQIKILLNALYNSNLYWFNIILSYFRNKQKKGESNQLIQQNYKQIQKIKLKIHEKYCEMKLVDCKERRKIDLNQLLKRQNDIQDKILQLFMEKQQKQLDKFKKENAEYSSYEKQQQKNQQQQLQENLQKYSQSNNNYKSKSFSQFSIPKSLNNNILFQKSINSNSNIQKQQIQLFYQLQIKQNVENPKFIQLLKILNDLSQNLENSSKQIQSQMIQGLDQSKHENVLIFCQNNEIKIHQFLFSQIYPQIEYFQKMRHILSILMTERKLRLDDIQSEYKASKSKRNKLLHPHLQRIVLQEQLYKQLQFFYYIMGGHIYKQKDQQWNKNSLIACKNELSKRKLKYIDLQKVKIPIDYHPQQQLIYKNNLRIFLVSNTKIYQIQKLLQLYKPDYCIMFSPNIFQIRTLILHQCKSLKSVFSISFKDSFQQFKVINNMKREDDAFWHIAKQRSMLPEVYQSAISRISQLKINDKIAKMGQKIDLSASISNQEKHLVIKGGNHQSIFNIKNVKRSIMIDKRQMRSLLPSYLYHFGFQIIPAFLAIGDYIISNQIGIQKKSVHTGDLETSLNSGRLQKQLQKLQKKFSRPYLLIQCNSEQYFNKNDLCCRTDKYKKIITRETKYMPSKVMAMAKIMPLLKKFPKVKVIWSTGLKKTCQYFRLLKQNQDQPQIDRFSQKEDEQKILQELNKGENQAKN